MEQLKSIPKNIIYSKEELYYDNLKLKRSN